MVEKMTAVVLIILTIIVCSAIPALMIMLTVVPTPTPKLLIGMDDMATKLVFLSFGN